MRFGLDRFVREDALLAELRGRRVGLLAHPASVTRELRHASEILREVAITPRMLFGPEHGYGGEAQDMASVASERDAVTGAPIVSLYGSELGDLAPKPEHLAEIDVLLVDLADVGSRYYTFVWSALLALRAAARVGVHVIALDRPNPLSGSVVEGATVAPGFSSFVGLESVPIRHALTLGEILALFGARDGLTLGASGALRVVRVDGVEAHALAPAWDRPFVLPSPNMPTFETALVYPGGCLLEGTNLSEGRGTTRPFEIVGAPWLDGRRLAHALEALALPGFVARPITFEPTFQKHARKRCGGVQIHVTDAAAFRPVETYVALVALAQRHHPDGFAFRTERYEYVDDIPAFDLLTGSAAAREAIVAGDPIADIARRAATVDPGWRDSMTEARSACARAAV